MGAAPQPGSEPSQAIGPWLPRRWIQVVLGLLWITDGILQLQPAMFGPHFLLETIEANAQGQPALLARSIVLAAQFALPHRVFWNACFASIQLLIGLGLVASRRTVRPALVVSFAWAAVVWWAGEGLGMLAMNTASPLTGAPGAVVLYAAVGLICWPRGRWGALGDRGARAVWALLWLLDAGLMLLPFNRDPQAIRYTFGAAADFMGSGPLATFDHALGAAFAGRGLAAALASLVVMALVGIGVLVDWHRNLVLVLGALLRLFLWVTAEYLGGLGGGSATDPGAGPLFLLLALSLMTSWRTPRLPFRGLAGRGRQAREG